MDSLQLALLAGVLAFMVLAVLDTVWSEIQDYRRRKRGESKGREGLY